jgi:hypothetical protein
LGKVPVRHRDDQCPAAYVLEVGQSLENGALNRLRKLRENKLNTRNFEALDLAATGGAVVFELRAFDLDVRDPRRRPTALAEAAPHVRAVLAAGWPRVRKAYRKEQAAEAEKRGEVDTSGHPSGTWTLRSRAPLRRLYTATAGAAGG